MQRNNGARSKLKRALGLGATFVKEASISTPLYVARQVFQGVESAYRGNRKSARGYARNAAESLLIGPTRALYNRASGRKSTRTLPGIESGAYYTVSWKVLKDDLKTSDTWMSGLGMVPLIVLKYADSIGTPWKDEVIVQHVPHPLYRDMFRMVYPDASYLIWVMLQQTNSPISSNIANGIMMPLRLPWRIISKLKKSDDYLPRKAEYDMKCEEFVMRFLNKSRNKTAGTQNEKREQELQNIRTLFNLKYFTLINLHNKTSIANVKKKFMTLSKQLHPNKNPEVNGSLFDIMKKEYDIIQARKKARQRPTTQSTTNSKNSKKMWMLTYK